MAKRLYKSQNRVLFGVCAGVADYLNADPTIIRLLMVVLGFVSFGTALIAYIIASFIIPERPFSRDDEEEHMRSVNEYDRSDDDFDQYFKKENKKDE